MAIKNKLLTLAFKALNGLGFEVWFWKGCGLDRYFPSVFGNGAKFPQQKSSNISPYFHSGNPVALRLRCVITHKTLFSPSFGHENTATKVPHFHGEMLVLGHAGALQSIKHIDARRIHGETNVT